MNNNLLRHSANFSLDLSIQSLFDLLLAYVYLLLNPLKYEQRLFVLLGLGLVYRERAKGKMNRFNPSNQPLNKTICFN